MNITINNYQYMNYKPAPSFGRSGRNYITKEGLDMSTVTCPFRSDVDWLSLAKFELRNFKDKNKVNIIQFASSDGSEAYTQIMSLLECGNYIKTKKFFPIKAYDIDEDIVKAAQSGLINLHAVDECDVAENCRNFSRYFFDTPQKLYIPDNFCDNIDKCYKTYRVAPTLTNKVIFNKGDIFKILPNIEDNSNTVILCRNMLAYFPEQKIIDTINIIKQRLKSGSLFITGALDKNKVDYYIRQSGFEEIMKHVFRKT